MPRDPSEIDIGAIIGDAILSARASYEASRKQAAKRHFLREPSQGDSGARLSKPHRKALVAEEMFVYDELSAQARPYAESQLRIILALSSARGVVLTDAKLLAFVEIALDHARTMAQDVAHAEKAVS